MTGVFCGLDATNYHLETCLQVYQVAIRECVTKEGNTVTTADLIALQKNLGLSDNKMAAALGVTRQTFRNWRTGRCFPLLAQNSIRWLMELRKLDPANDNVPERLRFKP
jgi:DNA-binding transcriptional regulator YiaG